MKKTLCMMALAVLVTAVCGCGPQKMPQAGFLSDYSKLQKESDSSYRYFNKTVATKYTAFILDTVSVHFKDGAKAIKKKSEGKVTEQDLKDLTNYFHSAIFSVLSEGGYKIAYQPGPGVARIRIAITDMEETNVVLAAIPQARLVTGAGVGSAAMEAEVVDSVTGVQIGAAVESKAGSRIPFTGLSEWGGAKAAMDEWAKRFKNRLDEASGKK